MAQRVKHLPIMRETWVRSLGQKDPLEKEMVTHSSILAWRIPWMEEPGRLQFMGFQRVRHHWATNTFTFSLRIIFLPLLTVLSSPKVIQAQALTVFKEWSEVVQSCPTLCDPTDCSLSGSSIHGILQAIIQEWVAMPFFRGSSQPRDQTHVSYISCIGRRVLYH